MQRVSFIILLVLIVLSDSVHDFCLDYDFPNFDTSFICTWPSSSLRIIKVRLDLQFTSVLGNLLCFNILPAKKMKHIRLSFWLVTVKIVMKGNNHKLVWYSIFWLKIQQIHCYSLQFFLVRDVQILDSPYDKGVPLPKIPRIHKLGKDTCLAQQVKHPEVISCNIILLSVETKQTCLYP